MNQDDKNNKDSNKKSPGKDKNDANGKSSVGPRATQPGVVAVGTTKKAPALSQLEADLASKARASSQRTGPAAVAPSSASSNLSQLEQDIAAKTTAAVAGSERLSQLERDVAAKAGVSRSSGTRPGALAVGGSNSLQQLESDISAKNSARRTDATGLEQVDRDVSAKAAARSSARSRPGAVAVGGEAGSSLQRLEQDIASKSSAGGVPSSLHDLERSITAKTGESSQPRTNRPGAVPVSTGRASLQELERGIAAKSASAGAVGAVPVSTGRASLQELERGIAAKSASAGAVPSSLHSLESQISSKVAESSTNSSSLAQLERDLAAKGAVGHGASRSAGAVSVSSGAASSLQELEGSLSAKLSASASNTNAVSSLNNLERDLARKVNNGQVPSQLSQLESDLAMKGGMRGSDMPTHTAPHAGFRSAGQTEAALLSVENEIAAKSVQMSASPSPQSATFSSLATLENSVTTKYEEPLLTAPVESHIGQIQTQGHSQIVDTAVDVERPLDTFASVDAPEAGGIEAFVADNVVDATGVAVIMSEEEEEKLERKKNKRFFCFVGIPLLILVAVVVPVAITRATSPAVLETEAPTGAPSVAPSFSPTTNTFDDVITCLRSNAVDSTALELRNTPQYFAAEWISLDPVSDNLLCDDRFFQRYALATMYYSMGGEAWDSCGPSDPNCLSIPGQEGWLTPSDHCDWYRVDCTGGQVTSIDFGGIESRLRSLTPLRGSIPKELSYLSSLTQFDIAGFEANGSIEGIFSNMPELQILDLLDNMLTGVVPDTFSKDNPKLRSLNLGGNKMSGEFPLSIGELDLRHLDLHGLGLSGKIPSSLGNSPDLRTLVLSGNSLTGGIPDSIYNLTELIVLELATNPLSGELSSNIGNLSNLKVISLNDTDIGGFIPDTFYSLTNLAEIDFGYCEFTGPLSSRLANMTDLVRFRVEQNDLTGPVPGEALSVLGLLRLEEIRLEGNRMTGSLEDICPDRYSSASRITEAWVDCVVTCACCDSHPSCTNS